MAVKQEFTFLSGDGKTDVHAVRWLPDNGDYRAVFQISHGMIEFIERYEPFAAFLADKGYMVVGHDHLGHGKTAKTPEDWGYFADGESPEILIGDMNKLRTLSRSRISPTSCWATAWAHTFSDDTSAYTEGDYRALLSWAQVRTPTP